MKYQVNSYFPPAIFSRHDGKFFIIAGGGVEPIEVDENVTCDDIEWIPKFEAKVQDDSLIQNSWEVESSKIGNFYKVEQLGDEWKCSCPGFTFRGDCKHIKKIKTELN